jgi:hypothetical protein
MFPALPNALVSAMKKSARAASIPPAEADGIQATAAGRDASRGPTSGNEVEERRWDVVAQLAKELEARRLARQTNIGSIASRAVPARRR